MKFSLVSIVLVSTVFSLYSSEHEAKKTVEERYEELRAEWYNIERGYDRAESQLVFVFTELTKLREEIIEKDNKERLHHTALFVTKGSSYLSSDPSQVSQKDRERKRALVYAEQWDKVDRNRLARQKMQRDIEDTMKKCEQELRVFYFVKRK